MMWLKCFAVLALVAVACGEINTEQNDLWEDVALGEPSSRLVNGNSARQGEFPWHATIIVKRQDQRQIFCSGVLVSRSCVLTLASCLDSVREIQTFLGSNIFGSGFSIQGRRFIRHPNFNTNRVLNLAVVQFVRPITPSRDIQPINLPSLAQEFVTFDNQNARFSGFGSQNPSAPFKFLQWGFLRILPKSHCNSVFPTLSTGFFLCAVSADHTKAHPGFGDNGAPLILHLNGRHVLVGLFSFGRANDLFNGAPSGYVNVARNIRWINRVLSQIN